MRKSIIWLILSCLMAVSLLPVSCAPAEVEEEEEVVITEEEEVVAAEEEEEVAPEEEPQYGGVFTLAVSSAMQSFDETVTPHYSAYYLGFIYDELLTGDYTKGPGGTGEATWLLSEFFPHLETGLLAESWEMPDDRTIIWHLRKGIHFIDKPPVNARELIADDVVFCVDRLFETSGSYLNVNYPPETRPELTALDKYTVLVEVPQGMQMECFRVGDFCRIVPREMVEEYGDMHDWEVQCGTGPFILTDYVDMSSATYERNPNYWRKHPIYGDQMPYVDGIKVLVIQDVSTRISALRTGKIDLLGVSWEDADAIRKTNPELKWARSLGITSLNLYMRVDKPELPFDDIKVRRALSMAIDREAIIDDYYGGNAELFTHPIMPVAELMDLYIPLEELPESTQELYGYDPEKAKQLLAEAGYPEGFKTSIICTSAYVDLLSVVKDNWAKIGVDLEIAPKDTAVYTGISMRNTHKEMIVQAAYNATYIRINNFYSQNFLNYSRINDPWVDEVYFELIEGWGDWSRVVELWKEFIPYALENCWSIQFPQSYSYKFWQPWIKDYHGESYIGFWNTYQYISYLWLDLELKEEMGH